MNKEFKGFLAGVFCTLLLTPTLVNAESVVTSVNAVFDAVKISVNGKSVPAPTLLIDGTTYAPLRAVAETVGYDIRWDSNTQTAVITNDWSYPIDPDRVIGTWNAVDYVHLVSQFDPTTSKDDLFLESLTFSSKNVICNYSNKRSVISTWTDDRADLFAGSCEFMIKTIDSKDYLFIEFKNGDYINGDTAGLYVFEKETPQD